MLWWFATGDCIGNIEDFIYACFFGDCFLLVFVACAVALDSRGSTCQEQRIAWRPRVVETEKLVNDLLTMTRVIVKELNKALDMMHDAMFGLEELMGQTLACRNCWPALEAATILMNVCRRWENQLCGMSFLTRICRRTCATISWKIARWWIIFDSPLSTFTSHCGTMLFGGSLEAKWEFHLVQSHQTWFHGNLRGPPPGNSRP